MFVRLGSNVLLLVGLNIGNLGGRSRGLVKLVGEPLGHQTSSKLDSNHPLAHAENLGVVGKNGSLDGEGVMCSHGSNTGHLVGGDGDTKTGTTDENGSVGLAGGHLLSSSNGNVGVGGLVFRGLDTNVNDLVDSRGLFEIGLDSVLVINASLVASNNNSESHFVQVCVCVCVCCVCGVFVC